MSIVAVINDLSLPDHFDDPPDPQLAARAMENLVETLRELRRRRSDITPLSDEPLPSLLSRLAPSWYADDRNRDKRILVKQLAGRSPYSSAMAPSTATDVEYRLQGQVATGLGWVDLLDGIGVSLTLVSGWESPMLTVERFVVREEDDGTLTETSGTAVVRHASQVSHVREHDPWLARHGLDGLGTAAGIWSARMNLFPDLRFLPDVEHQLTRLQLMHIRPVRELLAGFQESVRHWREAGEYGSPTWPGKVTLEHEQRRPLCWFEDPIIGERRLFDTHARYTPGPGRLHFCWDAVTQTVIVAYVGRKLGI